MTPVSFQWVISFLLFSVTLCASDTAETQVVDVVTYVEGIYSNLLETKSNLENTLVHIAFDLRQTDDSLAEYLYYGLKQLTESLIQSYYEGLLKPRVRNCINDHNLNAVESKMFLDGDLEKECFLGPKYSELLLSHYRDLVAVENPAKDLSAGLVNGNLWCSTNHDEPECYVSVSRQAVIKANEMNDIIVRAAKADLDAREDFDKSSAKCYEKTVAKLNQMVVYVEEHLQECAVLS